MMEEIVAILILSWEAHIVNFAIAQHHVISCASSILTYHFTSAPDCPKPEWVGDSFCDDAVNIPACWYDGGDCCDHDELDGSFQGQCTDCLCLLGVHVYVNVFQKLIILLKLAPTHGLLVIFNATWKIT